MAGKDVAAAPGAFSAPGVYNWVRKGASTGGKTDAMPIAPIDDDAHAYDGLERDETDCIRQLELENDILCEAVMRLKGVGLGEITNREKTLIIDFLRRKTSRSLKERIASLGISKSFYEYQRAAIARGDKYEAIREKVVGVFEAANRSRGYRCVTHALRTKEEISDTPPTWCRGPFARDCRISSG